ncbi:Bromodomain-containing protein [Hesseltinella vesiculosa]|uniref:Bromodomain-containing protein n=1 Tax=Hesseltinella vesiculosa TaxID=101127 RepID=A0A1X2GGE9_9FUNG|nr:Bromodomain-containing protein [Hesseltinella vesiculosa]
MQIGGKRPFALLQQDQDYNNSQDDSQPIDDDDDFEYEDDFDDDDNESVDTHRRQSTSSTATNHTTSSTSKHAKKRKAKSQSSKPKKRGRPTNKAVARAATVAAHRAAAASDKERKKDFKVICGKTLDALIKKDAYGFFIEPVNTAIVKDYLTVVKRPMDFSTMKKNLAADKYHSTQDFQSDFSLIVNNAKLYNAPDTVYWKSAEKLQSFGLKAIQRMEKQILEESPPPPSSTSTHFLIPASYASSTHPLTSPSSSWRRKSVKEEEVDIMSLDGPSPPFRKFSTVLIKTESERTTREPSLDPSHRPSSKKKKKKHADAGVTYSSDGSIQAVPGAVDVYAILPPGPQFHEQPRITILNPQALPSAFYSFSRGYHDEWHSHRHFVQSSMFSDFGPFPFTTLGTGTPAMFYHPDTAHRVYAMYGDDTGEAYLKSLWRFYQDIGLGDMALATSEHITDHAWDLAQPVIDAVDPSTKKLKDPLPASQPISTGFGVVNINELLASAAASLESTPPEPAPAEP